MAENLLKEITATFESFRHYHDISNVFEDWLELVAIEISNPVDLKNRERRNKRYKRIMERYSQDDFQKFGNMLGMLTLLLEKEPDDYLGRLYMQLELYNSFRGQYFTPMNIAELMGRLQFNDAIDLLKKQDYITANDPACGSAVMMIAFYKMFRVHGYNPQRQLRVFVNDIDSKAVHMAYIQLSLLGLNAIVTQGDTLKLEMRDAWYSPGYFFKWGSGDYKIKTSDLRVAEKVRELVIEDAEPMQLSFF